MHPPTVSSVVQAIESAPDTTSILIDFDQTLFLRNSTEEYLRSLYPRASGALLLIGLEQLKPWYWLPGKLRGESSRDWLRVVIATLLFPWTLLLWPWRAKALAQNYSNQDLVAAIAAKPDQPAIVVTNGFAFIIKPILRSMALPDLPLIALRFWQGGRDRSRGKLALAEANLGSEVLDGAMLITDSYEDAPLLGRVAQPYLMRWPQAHYVPALQDAYIPFFYSKRVKHPNQKFLRRVILEDELISLLVTLSWVSPQPFWHGVGLTFLVLSFWCIYEVGYMENDLVAELYEANPTLSPTYQQYKHKINFQEPWLWAILLALPGVILFTQDSFLRSNQPINLDYSFWQTTATSFALWLGVLLSVRLTFYLYNYLDGQARIWIYPLLQIHKYFGFLLITVVNSVALLYFCSRVIARWMFYFIYRNGGDTKNFPGLFTHIIIFSFLVIVLSFEAGSLDLLNNHVVLLIGILLYRARHEIQAIWSSIKFLPNQGKPGNWFARFSLLQIFRQPRSTPSEAMNYEAFKLEKLLTASAIADLEGKKIESKKANSQK